MSNGAAQESWTDRDRAWNAALCLAHETSRFTVNGVLEKAALRDRHRRTVRRVLRVMEATSWVKQETEGSPYWNPGPKITNQLYFASVEF